MIIRHPNTEAQSTSACCGTNPPTAPREIVFPYYSLADGFNSTLLLVSDSGSPLDFVVAVHSLRGQTQLSNSMTIQPGAKLPIDMRSLLTGLGADVTATFAQGSVSVYFEGTIMPLLGQMTIENPQRHWVQQAEMVENDPGRTDIPAVLSGQWWGLAGGRDATIMVSNASANSMVADVLLAFGGKQYKLQPLVFNPNETKQLSVAGMLAGLSLDVAQAPEGRITIIQQGSTPSLVAQGRVTDPVTGFSTTLEFPDPARQHASALHASGIPVGTPTADSPYAGDGTFTPHVIISNLSSQPQSATITAEYPEGAKLVAAGEKEFDGESGTGVGQMTLATLQVAAASTEDFSLAAEIGQLPLPIPYASLRIQYSGPPGSMIAQVSSVDERQDLVIDARTANERDGWAGSGVNPWHVDDQTNSILFLTDESDKPARIGFRVTAGGVTYWLTNLELQPHETRAIDLRKLRDSQRADFQGNKIPAGATDGGVSWIRLDSVAVEGRLMVIQKGQGMASSYDCEACSCPASFSGLSVAPGTFGLVPTVYQDMSSTGTYHSCNGGGNFYYNLTGGSSWSSNNTPVIQMNSSIHYRAMGMSAGTASVSASYTDCSMYDTNPDFECPCINWDTYDASGAGTVVTVGIIGGNNFVLWGSDQSVLAFNKQQAQGTPSGGQYSWTANNSRVSFDNAALSTPTLTAQSPSTALLDTQLTVHYTYNQTNATPASHYITVRIYKYLQQSGQVQVIMQNGPTQYGYIATAFYDIYTNPGGQRVPAGFTDVPTNETVTVNSVTPANYSVTLHQGSGTTFSDSEIHDDLSILAQSAIPQNLHINASQDISVSGIFVRSNTLDWYASGPVVTSNGPSN